MFYHLHQNLERNGRDVSASLRALDDVHRMSGGSTDNLGGNLRIIVKNLYDIVNQVCTVGDCEVISRLLGEWLDKEDFIEDSYILEVSSPGLGRPLKKEKDFARSIGKDVEIRLYKAIDKQKEFTGTLTSYDADSVTITMEDGSERTFEKSGIALIRLAFDF